MRTLRGLQQRIEKVTISARRSPGRGAEQRLGGGCLRHGLRVLYLASSRPRKGFHRQRRARPQRRRHSASSARPATNAKLWDVEEEAPSPQVETAPRAHRGCCVPPGWPADPHPPGNSGCEASARLTGHRRRITPASVEPTNYPNKANRRRLRRFPISIGTSNTSPRLPTPPISPFRV